MASIQYDKNYSNLLNNKAKDLIKLWKPISICMFFVVCSVSILYTEDHYANHTILINSSVSASAHLKQTLNNVLLYIGMLVLVALLGILCCKLRFYRLILHFLMLLTSIILSFAFVVYTRALLIKFNLPLDSITLVLAVWNFVFTGIVAMYWYAPLLIRQGYLILLAAQLALLLVKYLPYWTNWALLVAVALWDIVAVFCKKGPVNILIRQIIDIKGDLSVPVLIYSTNGTEFSDFSDERRVDCSSESIAVTLETFDVAILPECNMPLDSINTQSDMGNDTDCFASDITSLEIFCDLKLGLGDFIFYSVLLAQTQLSCNWTTTLACFIAILVGLSFTFFLLFKYQRDLPALPLSIGLGLLFCLSTFMLINPLIDSLAVKQIFI